MPRRSISLICPDESVPWLRNISLFKVEHLLSVASAATACRWLNHGKPRPLSGVVGSFYDGEPGFFQDPSAQFVFQAGCGQAGGRVNAADISEATLGGGDKPNGTASREVSRSCQLVSLVPRCSDQGRSWNTPLRFNRRRRQTDEAFHTGEAGWKGSFTNRSSVKTTAIDAAPGHYGGPEVQILDAKSIKRITTITKQNKW